MNSEVIVTIGGERRAVPRGTRIRELLDGAQRRELVAARVNGRIVDLGSALESDAEVEPVAAASPQGLEVLRHSTAHLMGQAGQTPLPRPHVTFRPLTPSGFL